MFQPTHRRTFLGQVAHTGLLAAAGEFGFVGSLPPLSAQEVRQARNLARVADDLEPLVRLIEDTPQSRLLEALVGRLRSGLTYQQLLAAVMLAGVRGIQPRPVGFKFHAVLVVNSAHLASLAAHDRDRWLPLIWSCDNFKRSQERNRQEGDWRMTAIDEARLPAAAHAASRFREAMDRWDTEAADVAIAAWTRTAGANEIYEAFWRYGARDFRDIGHKAIFVANSYRTLQVIGWRHAEPILRSLAYALLDHGRDPNPATSDLDADRPWRDNLRRAARLRHDWQRGRIASDATVDLLAALRTATPGEAAEAVVAQLNAGVDPASVWDAIFLMAGELLMRQPGIVSLHTVTTMNALAFAYQTTANDETRRMMLLQAASFLTMFRRRMETSNRLPPVRLDSLEPLPPTASGADAIDEIFADISRDKMTAARKTLAVLQTNGAHAEPLLAAARRLIFSKGNDSHDYKFSSAALEDFYHVTPAWRTRFLASSVFWLRGSGSPDTDLVRRIRAALSAP
ncbi:MAG: hypothetical protein NZO58_03050 [Gemmataceae bacterium]|nr:hypothetical protein [Gemmataceae bacterium]